MKNIHFLIGRKGFAHLGISYNTWCTPAICFRKGKGAVHNIYIIEFYFLCFLFYIGGHK